MRKLLPAFVALNLLLLNFLALTPGKAVSLSPSSGTLPANAPQTISIVASPPSGAEAVQVRLTVSGDATVTGYTGPTDSAWSPGAIGVCTGSATYTSSEICVDLANSGTITNGESLGSFTIRTGSEGGSVSIVRASENGYLVGAEIESQTGTVGTYSIGDSTLTTLPNTAIVDDPKYVIVMGALSLVLAGVLIYRLYPVFQGEGLDN